MDVDNYWLKVYSEGDESIKGWLAPEDSEVTGEAFDRLYPFLFLPPVLKSLTLIRDYLHTSVFMR